MLTAPAVAKAGSGTACALVAGSAAAVIPLSANVALDGGPSRQCCGCDVWNCVDAGGTEGDGGSDLLGLGHAPEAWERAEEERQKGRWSLFPATPGRCADTSWPADGGWPTNRCVGWPGAE